MAFKEYDHRPSFLEIELSNIIGKSRTQKFLSDVDSYIEWKPFESIVTSGYPVGQSDYGNKAYPPLMLLKATLLQKWFGIKSDPELENQSNAALTQYEIQRNRMISKVRYKIEQYFGITEKYHGAGKARFTTILKES